MIFNLALLAAAGVATAPVELVNDTAAMASCERLGEVRGSSKLGGLLMAKAYDKALSQMKTGAAKLTGTHVLLLNAQSGHSGANMLGVAYRCGGKQ